ncbi:acetyl-CoA carboxylase carboxyl transferase subunit beta [Actinopolyspora biskrensis]|uniref:Multifunctional fusion protein n=1 Tax=Actinopolyspora biskrensis TaxID=1470178 RepID=A0A852Z4J3_9ACTN|nr:acetyl-CoA carboxylase, carboxyltransferase subunit beta [Actinopolyspora biskrensis]NYH80932.1 acetyl-CoA carboxylase carboxyl transferase subunit beta [Actinopolyspora biskrensis]
MTKPATRRTGEETDWTVCPGCGDMLYGRRLARNLRVCPECGHHHRLTAHARVEQLFDEEGLELLDIAERSVDVLGFSDTKPYTSRLEQARAATGLEEGVVLATGTIRGHPVAAAVMDFRFLGGSLGSATGEAITRAAEIASDRRVPLLLVTASGGARMQEGALSLMQMAKTSQALGRLDEEGLLTVSLVTDPTYGGVAASFATLCDVIIAEPGARLGFAGPRVIEQTIRQTLPEGFQTAESLLEQGMIDAIRPRNAQRTALARLLAAGRRRTGRPKAVGTGDVVVREGAELPRLDAWQTVQRARDLDRPTTLDYVGRVFDDFEELRGDRGGGECSALIGGVARLGDRPVVVLGHQKGHTITELTNRNYGMATPAGYRKAARLMRVAEKLSIPVVTFVDTPGAFPGVEAEQHGQAVAIAENIRLMAGLSVPIVALITGEGGSGGALGLAVADEVLICSNGVYSVISPEGCASILWSDPSKAPTAANALGVDSRRLLEHGIVDGVIPEPEDGSQSDHALVAERVRGALEEAVDRLAAVDPTTLRERRRARFRRFGATAAQPDENEEGK